MTRPTSPLRRLVLVLAAVALVASAVPAGLEAAVARPIRLEAGPQRGYTFSSTGAVLTSKSVVLSAPATVQSSGRVWITGKGAHHRITSGALAGYLVKESMTAYYPGIIVTRAFSPAARVSFPAGTYLGYRFDSSWRISATKRGFLPTSSAALTARRAVILGRPFAEMTSGTWAGYWIPITTPTTLTAQRLTCASPGHVAAGSPQYFRGVLPGAQGQVALTFDMGGRIAPGLDIVNRLILDRVCTTFFPTGAMTNTVEGQRIMRLVGAHPELFELGNHTMHHCNLRDGGGGSPSTSPCPRTAPSQAFIVKQLKDAEAILRAVSGMHPAPYWRAPYGAVDSRVLSAAASAGYTKTFHWDIDTIDWRPVADGGPTAAQIAEKVVSRAVSGSDVLMHLGGWNTYDALPSMVQRLRQRGLQPTTISDILR